MLAQWQDNVCLFTFLEEYKKNPHSAEPWAAMTMYNELVNTHAVALSRFDYNPLHLSKVEAKHLMELLRIFYVQGNQYEVGLPIENLVFARTLLFPCELLTLFLLCACHVDGGGLQSPT